MVVVFLMLMFLFVMRVEWLTKMAQLQRGSVVVVGGWRRWIGQMQRQQAALPEPGALFDSYTYYAPTEKERGEDPKDSEAHHEHAPPRPARHYSFFGGKKKHQLLFSDGRNTPV
jgi:hypothetical protein